VTGRLVGVRRPPPRRLAACWALGVAGLGLALAVLGPPPAAPGPPGPLDPGNVVARAERHLPAGAHGVRVALLSGRRFSGSGWTFVVTLNYRGRGGRLAERDVVLPRAPVPFSVPVPLTADYRLCWPASRLARFLARTPAGATVVSFLAPTSPRSW
jgi:hypothetical protein